MKRRNEIALVKQISDGTESGRAWEILREKFEHIETVLHDKWVNTRHEDNAGREACWMQLHALQQIALAFKLDVDDAKLAQKALDDMKGEHTDAGN